MQLAKLGFEVSLFDSSNEIMQLASKNNQNRLHMGLHYPRDLPTAIQSRIGFSKFIETFPSAVRYDFDNYYALSKKNSRVSKEEFTKFIVESGIVVNAIETPKDLFSLGFEDTKINGLWKCQEGVIDIESLSHTIRGDLESCNVNQYLGTKVNKLNLVGNKWLLESENDLIDEFDWIVRATYGQDEIQSNSQNIMSKTYEFHQTMIMEVSSNYKPFGLTIIDGDFLTILPKGFSSNFLIYAPSISIRHKIESSTPPKLWQIINEVDQAKFSIQIIDRIKDWIPNFEVLNILQILQTTRSIKPNKSKTDERTSDINLTDKNFLDIWSGKIDHCIDIAEKVCKIVSDDKS